MNLDLGLKKSIFEKFEGFLTAAGIDVATKDLLLSFAKNGIILGTNLWSGLHSQQTGILRLTSGDFSISYENDGSPFDKPFDENGIPHGILGDGNDRWRTAAMTINIGSLHTGFNLFTGERDYDSY